MTTPKLTPLAAALAFLAAPALADITADQVVESLTGQGYTDVVVADPADGMISATATRADGLAVTVIYDAVSGEVQSATAADAAAAAAAAPAAGAAEPAESQDMDDGAAAGEDTGAAAEPGDDATGETVEPEGEAAEAGDDGQQGG